MGLIKDGKVYRTEYEQIVHLTEKHEEQASINEYVSQELANVSAAANQGGYNLVRFSFQRSGTFYRIDDDAIMVLVDSDKGDYFEFTTGNAKDIPAYGFCGMTDSSGRSIVSISFRGDFTEKYTTLTVRNITKNSINQSVAVNMSPFAGTGLQDYNPNDNKRQLFQVIDDLTYGGRTQYASFDLNRDGKYNFVFIGAVVNGKDGAAVYSATNETFDDIHSIMKRNDTVIICSEVPNIPILPDAVLGDVYKYIKYDRLEKMGNIRGPKGEKGDKGDTGATGATGPQGPAGEIGAPGPIGQKGEPGQSLRIHDGIKSTPEELPIFSTTMVADAYVVLNTNGEVATYDLYYHAIDGNNWSILPNWGGVPGPTGKQGPKGEQGPTGATGPQGPIGLTGPQGEQGIQGERGPQGPKGDIGPQGEIGPQGPRGKSGLDGERGPQGPQGEIGPQGPKGDTGPQGPQGEIGPQGPKGDTGPKGDKGAKGDPGYDVPTTSIWGNTITLQNGVWAVETRVSSGKIFTYIVYVDSTNNADANLFTSVKFYDLQGTSDHYLLLTSTDLTDYTFEIYHSNKLSTVRCNYRRIG